MTNTDQESPLDRVDALLLEARACVKKAKTREYDRPAFLLMARTRLQQALEALGEKP